MNLLLDFGGRASVHVFRAMKKSTIRKGFRKRLRWQLTYSKAQSATMSPCEEIKFDLEDQAFAETAWWVVEQCTAIVHQIPCHI